MDLKKFDSILLEPCKVSLFIGPSGCGKITKIQEYLKSLNTVNGLITSEEKKINELFNHQRQARKKFEKAYLVIKVIKNFNDDMTKLRFLFLTGRTHLLCTFISMEYCVYLPVILRINVDYIFVYKTENKESLNRIYQYYGRMLGSFETFLEVIEKYGCVVFDTKENQAFYIDSGHLPGA